MIRILLHSQDAKLKTLFAATLGADFQIEVEGDSERIRRIVSSSGCDVVILDMDSNAKFVAQQMDLFDSIRGCQVPVLVMTEDDRRSTAMDLVRRGVYDYFCKPPSLAELKLVVRRAHEHATLRRELEQAQKQLSQQTGCDRLVGASQRSQVVYDLIRRVADLNAFVLVTGESGTGKELVAKAIHNLSNRSKQPFVAVSCGAIPETLIESELFGHEKGAFTGTTGAREGYLEQAGGGTLFLDEIGELSLQTQVKLLRVLQERSFSRLGSNRLIPLRARIVFATHRNLMDMVAEGKFRQDLYYRVNVMRINVPALRDRTEDIPQIANHLLRQYSEAYCKPIQSIEPNTMALLLEHDWPGNVRELENVIQGAIIIAEGSSLRTCDLPEALQQPDVLGVGDALPSGSFEEQLRDYKIRLANKAIEECNGNKTLAARSLCISRAYLHRLIRDGAATVDAVCA